MQAKSSSTELVRGMAQAAGVPARLLPVPVWALQASATLLGKGDAVQRLCGNLQVDISKARSECARRGGALTLTRMSYFITMLLKYSTTKDCHGHR